MSKRRALLSGFCLFVASTWLLSVVLFRIDERPLAIPVEGVTAVSSSFGAPRAGGRKHQGADIFAARGTRVRAAAGGFVVHVGTLPLGGRVVHVLGRRGILFYYAHLDDWAPGISFGDWVSEGEVLGFVGTSGNAQGTPPHLHFETRPLAYLLAKPLDPATLFRR